MLRRITAIAAVATLAGPLGAPIHAQPATAPATAPFGQDAQRLRARITGVEGVVQVREAEDQPWRRAQVGMIVDEGAEFRTGPRSAVRFVLPPDQTVTLDRLGVVKLVTAVREADRVVTDLGMPYGRTRYDVEAAGLEHTGTIRSPGATLAIRGTQVNLYDQPPYNVEARSLTGRAIYKTSKSSKQIALGNRAGRTERAEGDTPPAETRLAEEFVDPYSSWGNTPAENILLLSLQAYGGSSFKDLGVLGLLDQAGSGFEGTVTGSLPVGELLSFSLAWSGTPFSDVNLSITSPLGEVLSVDNPQVNSSGVHSARDSGNGVANGAGFGQENALWTVSFPRGTYTINAQLVSGANADVDIFVIQDPQGRGDLIGSFNASLDGSSPTFTTTVQAPAAGGHGGTATLSASFEPIRNRRDLSTSRAAKHGGRRR